MAVMKLSDDELNNISGGAGVNNDGFAKVMQFCPYCNTTHEVTEVSGGRFTCGVENKIFTATSVSGNAVAAATSAQGTTVARGIGGKTMSGNLGSDMVC